MHKDMIPENWSVVTVSDVGITVTGNTPPTKDKSNYGEYLPYIKPPQLKNEPVGSSEEFLSEKGASLARVLPENAILVSCIGNLGRTALNTVPVAFNQQINAIIPSDGILPKFIFYQTQSPDFRSQLEEKATATTISIVNKGNFEKITLNLAPLDEQRRIVAKIEALFSELDKGVESLKTAREQLKIYRQAVLKHAFGGKLTARWREENADKLESPEQLLARIQQERETRYQQQLQEWEAAVKAWEKNGKKGKKLSKPRRPDEPDKPSSEHLRRMWDVPTSWQWLQVGSFCFVTKLAGFEYTKHVSYDDNGDLPVIKAENAGPNGFRVTQYSHVNSATVSSLTRSHLGGGELLMVFVGAGTGNVAMVPEEKKFFLGPNIGMMRVETNDVIPKYVELFLRSPKGKDLALAAVKAVAQPSLSMGTIRQIPIALSSFTEQEAIVAEIEKILSAIEKLEAEVEAQLNHSELLRQSILKKAFLGNLVSQDLTPIITLLPVSEGLR